MRTIAKAESFLLKMLFVSTAVTCLAALGCAHYQTLAAISDEQQLGTSALLRPPGAVQRLPAVVDRSSVVLTSAIEPHVGDRNAPTSENTEPVTIGPPFEIEWEELPGGDASETLDDSNERTLVRSAKKRLADTRPMALQVPAPQPVAFSTLPETGKFPPITLHLDDVEVRKALELLSRQGSMNILVAPGVSGRVTVNFLGLRLDRAVDAILRLSNLVAHREDGLLFVYTPEEFHQMKVASRKLVSRVYKLNYMRADDLAAMITPFLTPDLGRVATTPASEVGIATDIDQVGGDSLAGGDALIVYDEDSVLERIDQIVAELDVRPIQVVIEAVILEILLEDDMELGVNFAFLDGAGNVLTLLGNGAAINAAAGFSPASVITSGGKLVEAFAVNEHGFKFGFVGDDVTGFIRALQEVGETNILASPRILVLNKQRSELIIGEKIGFKTLTVTQTSTVEKVEYLNVGTQLRLRPFVAADGMIRMEIHPERSTGELVDGVPQTRTAEITTNVIVPDGATIILAGLIEDETVVKRTGIPVLSDLPWVGALFRSQKSECKKKEVVILLTPRIWHPQLAPPQ